MMEKSGKGVLLWVVLLNLAIIVSEIYFSAVSNSVALLSDAMHNTGDISALLLALAAATLSERKATKKKTFGYSRAEIIAAEINSLLILAVALFLVYESLKKITHPSEIKGRLVMLVASIALAGNVASALILREGSEHNINRKGAYLHMVADAGTSLAVVGGGAASYFFGLNIVDPLIGIGVAVVIFIGGMRLFMEAVHILMEGAPDVDVEEIRKKALKIEGVKDMHSIRCWKLSDKEAYFVGHLVVSARSLKDAVGIRKSVERCIKKEGITNVTLQIESAEECGEKANVL
ncbi:MAG: cation transporter [Thermoplasmata archaeon]|nr:cation transporter [Thermoplasmata archaeon]